MKPAIKHVTGDPPSQKAFLNSNPRQPRHQHQQHPTMAQSRFLAPFRVLERTLTPSIRTSQPQFHHAPTILSLSRTTTLNPRSTLLPISQVRHASHASQGTANQHSPRPAGKRLGAKRTNGEYVVPGVIIFRQRGTHWFAGENCGVGRDHTIYAEQAGYVRYYRDPNRSPDRKYIGIVFEKDGQLPTPLNAPTRRKLNKVFIPRRDMEAQAEMPTGDMQVIAGEAVPVQAGSASAAEAPPLRPGYMYRESNWQIGRTPEKVGVKLRPHKPGNRWLAWRKRHARALRAAQWRNLKSKGKGKGKKKGKGRR